jgi:hypothetical protein
MLQHYQQQQQQQQQKQQQQKLRLASFCSDWVGTPGVLAALSAHHLTSLNLLYRAETVSAVHAITEALAQLTNLQQLRLTKGVFDRWLAADSCLSAVAQLVRLTKLTLEGAWPDMALRELLTAALPLQHLDLGKVDSVVFHDSHEPVLDMHGLSQLQELAIVEVPGGCLLPPQLWRLTLITMKHAGSLSAVMALSQLQELSLGPELRDPVLLLPLGQLPALTHLALEYLEADRAAATAAAWPQLSQLRQLRVEYMDEADSEEQATILAAVSTCTGLTKLQLQIERNAPYYRDEFLGIAVATKLAGLTRLQNLSVPGSYGALAPGDAQALSTLTGLTRLVLHGAGQGVDDVAATALACCLRQLRHLDLSGCDLGSMACLAAIGQLVQLTALRLSSHSEASELTERGLMLLTGLSCLQQLDIIGNATVSHEALQRFWPACPLRAVEYHCSDCNDLLNTKQSAADHMKYRTSTLLLCCGSGCALALVNLAGRS